MRRTLRVASILWLAGACPGDEPTTTNATTSGDTTSTSPTAATVDSEDADTALPTTGNSSPPGETTDTTTDTTTTAETTTGGPLPETTRVLYSPFVEILGQPQASALRYVEVVGGVPSPPVTILDPPGEYLVVLDTLPDSPWLLAYSAVVDAAQLWLIDMATLTAHEVTLPPEIEEIVGAGFLGKNTYLGVVGGPQDGDGPEDVGHYVCELGADASCDLLLVEPATGPTTYVESVSAISGTTGRIWYTTHDIIGTGVSILMGDVAAPEDAALLISFPDESASLHRVAQDEETIYLNIDDGLEHAAMDITTDPPGPLVPIHPPFPAKVRLNWAPDESAFTMWDGPDQFGDLFLVEIDGTNAGPLQPFNADSPGHVNIKPAQWTADSTRVLFFSDHATPMYRQLYFAEAADPGSLPLRINGALEPTGQINSVFLRGDPDHVIFFGQTTDMTPNELYRGRLTPPAESHKLNAPLADGFLLDGAFDISADGQRVIYGGQEIAGRIDLLLVDIDGEVPAPAINLTADLPDDTDVDLYGKLAPDASAAFFAGQGPDNERRGLFMVPLSPSIATPIQISADDEPVFTYKVLPQP